MEIGWANKLMMSRREANPRSGFKISDQVQGQGAGRSRKRSPPQADEHLSEAVLHPNL